MRPWLTTIFAVAFGLSMSAHGPSAETFPTKPLRIVVPFSAGGPADVAARIIAQELTESLGRRVVVENKPGSGSITADSDIAFGPKDGHNLLLETTGFTITQLTRKNLPFSTSNFAPVSQISAQPYALLIPSSLPAKTVPEFIEYAKARPGKLNFAGTGVGSATTLNALRFASMAGLKMVSVQYGGQGPGELAVMANEVQLLFDNPITAIPIHRDGRARIIGITSASRLDIAQEIPTVTEQGIPLVVSSWYGLFVASGTPRPIIERLNTEIVKAVASERYRSRLVPTGVVPTSSTPEELAKLLADTMEEYRKVLQ